MRKVFGAARGGVLLLARSAGFTDSARWNIFRAQIRSPRRMRLRKLAIAARDEKRKSVSVNDESTLDAFHAGHYRRDGGAVRAVSSLAVPPDSQRRIIARVRRG